MQLFKLEITTKPSTNKVCSTLHLYIVRSQKKLTYTNSATTGETERARSVKTISFPYTTFSSSRLWKIACLVALAWIFNRFQSFCYQRLCSTPQFFNLLTSVPVSADLNFAPVHFPLSAPLERAFSSLLSYLSWGRLNQSECANCSLRAGSLFGGQRNVNYFLTWIIFFESAEGASFGERSELASLAFTSFAETRAFGALNENNSRCPPE